MLQYSRLLFVLFLLVFLTACAEVDSLDEESDNTGVRTETDVPNAPVNNGVPVNNGAPVNNGTNNRDTNNGTTPTNNGTIPGCPENDCIVGTTQCQGDLEQICVDDPANPSCGVWDAAVACASPQQTCVDYRCAIPTGCVDNDNDGFGLNCTAGRDCDDNDANNFPGNAELCDGVDNNCDGVADDGLDLGSMCTEGTGVCAATGVTACDPQGVVFCDTQGTAGEPEICDGIDNDCDNVIDNGGVCDVCALDPNDPNETVTTGTALNPDTRLGGIICPSDEEYFALNIQTGTEYRLYLGYPEFISDLDVEIYSDGTLLATFNSATVDWEGVILRPAPNTTYTARVVRTGDPMNLFYINLLENWACPAEDPFAPNETRAKAPYLMQTWRVKAYVCNGLSDWYSLGTLNAADVLRADLWDRDSSGDLDFLLWADVNGDGTVTLQDYSVGSGSDEFFTTVLPATTEYFLEVRDYAGIGDDYEIQWYIQ